PVPLAVPAGPGPLQAPLGVSLPAPRPVMGNFRLRRPGGAGELAPCKTAPGSKSPRPQDGECAAHGGPGPSRARSGNLTRPPTPTCPRQAGPATSVSIPDSTYANSSPLNTTGHQFRLPPQLAEILTSPGPPVNLAAAMPSSAKLPDRPRDRCPPAG